MAGLVSAFIVLMVLMPGSARAGDFWGGFSGGLAGAVIGNFFGHQQHQYWHRPPYYGPPPYYPPEYDPVADCAARFRTYDPRSGYYRGYDGFAHRCP